MSKKTKLTRQEVWVVAGAIAVILTAVFTTWYFSDALLETLNGDSQEGYKNVTFADAVVQCQQKAQAEFPKGLTQVTLDDHSSRFDSLGKRYRLFFTVAIGGGSEAELYLRCTVSTRGRILNFTVDSKQLAPTEAGRKDKGGVFGWP